MAARRRVLVTGASGLLGGRLAQLLAATHDVTALRHRSPTPEGLPVVEADLLAPASLALAVERARPDAIVHSAALADVDACEADPERARLSNVAASAFLARLSHAHGIRLVALSTDLVLTGERAWSTEDARPAPSLVYARTSSEFFDMFVRVCDVAPDGRSENVCDGLIRVLPGMFPPGADGVRPVEVELWPMGHVFRRGHRIRVQLAGAAHPRYARNTGTGEPLGTAARLQPVDYAVYHDDAHPSAVKLPVRRP